MKNMLLSLNEQKTLLSVFFFVIFFLYYFLDQIINSLKLKIKRQSCSFSSRKVLDTIDSKDRISRLPDEVLGYILGFLTTKSAVKTSILSKRWRYAWASAPALEFSRQEFTRVDVFIRFVNRVLKSRRGTDIQVFILEWKQQFDEGRARKWLDRAARRSIRKLVLDIQPISTFSLPASLLRCSSLQVCNVQAPRGIKPSSWDSGRLIPVVADSIVRLPRSFNLIQLRSLAFYAVANPSNLLGKLISSCPVLEYLYISIRQDDLIVSAPNLKSLALSCAVNAKTSKIHILAPRLEKVWLSLSGIPEFSLDFLECLMNATIWKSQRQDVDAQRFFSIMQRLGYARNLQLEGAIIEFLTKHLSSFSLRFDILISLRIEALLNEDAVQTIILLFRACPNLERLVIHNTKAGCITLSDHWTPTELDSTGTINNLKEVRIICFIGDKDELGLAKFFLQNGITLEKIYINCKEESLNFDNFKKISQRLLAIPRASPSALVYLD